MIGSPHYKDVLAQMSENVGHIYTFTPATASEIFGGHNKAYANAKSTLMGLMPYLDKDGKGLVTDYLALDFKGGRKTGKDLSDRVNPYISNSSSSRRGYTPLEKSGTDPLKKRLYE